MNCEFLIGSLASQNGGRAFVVYYSTGGYGSVIPRNGAAQSAHAMPCREHASVRMVSTANSHTSAASSAASHPAAASMPLLFRLGGLQHPAPPEHPPERI